MLSTTDLYCEQLGCPPGIDRIDTYSPAQKCHDPGNCIEVIRHPLPEGDGDEDYSDEDKDGEDCYDNGYGDGDHDGKASIDENIQRNHSRHLAQCTLLNGITIENADWSWKDGNWPHEFRPIAYKYLHKYPTYNRLSDNAKDFQDDLIKYRPDIEKVEQCKLRDKLYIFLKNQVPTLIINSVLVKVGRSTTLHPEMRNLLQNHMKIQKRTVHQIYESGPPEDETKKRPYKGAPIAAGLNEKSSAAKPIPPTPQSSSFAQAKYKNLDENFISHGARGYSTAIGISPEVPKLLLDHCSPVAEETRPPNDETLVTPAILEIIVDRSLGNLDFGNPISGSDLRDASLKDFRVMVSKRLHDATACESEMSLTQMWGSETSFVVNDTASWTMAQLTILENFRWLLTIQPGLRICRVYVHISGGRGPKGDAAS